MTQSSRQQLIEDRFLELIDAAGLPAPDETAQLSRAVIFLWYETKAFVLVDLDEIPDGHDPLDGLDIERLATDLGVADFGFGFAETA